MTVTVVVGAQWGDEGKGKIVDVLAASADFAARFGGGANAGHTLVVNGTKTVIRLVPSGILQPHPRCVLGPGMVIDPDVLDAELRGLRDSGVDVSARRVGVSISAHVVMPYHVAIDTLREGTSRGLGTTKRGIGPAYEDKVARRGLRVGDLLDATKRRACLEGALEAWAPIAASLGGTLPSLGELVALAERHATRIGPYVADVSAELQTALRRGASVLAEGAQGTLLDVDHGTYPYVTSSSVVAGAAAAGLGIGPTHIRRVIGIAKAYTTRVGAGPFPTELHDAVGERIRTVGGEFGSVTGRPRRTGWLDLVLLRQAAELNGLTDLVLTKADVLAGLETLRVCTAHAADGSPVYEDLPGYDAIGADLPRGLRRLIELVEGATRAPVRWLGTGPGREALRELSGP